MLGDLVTITAKPHPFREARQVLFAEQGITIAEMVDSASSAAAFRHHAVVFMAGEVIPAHMWSVARPKAGTHVEIRVLPTGGGSESR